MRDCQAFFKKIFLIVKKSENIFPKGGFCGNILAVGGLDMSFLKKLFGIGNKPGSPAYRLEQAKKLHGQAVKYVTEHRNDNDDVIGRGGYVSLIDDKIVVDSSGERIFVCEAKEAEISWLMSGNGVVINGPNSLEGGNERTITVHFVYHRK